jgi:hypothetical protein
MNIGTILFILTGMTLAFLGVALENLHLAAIGGAVLFLFIVVGTLHLVGLLEDGVREMYALNQSDSEAVAEEFDPTKPICILCDGGPRNPEKPNCICGGHHWDITPAE